MTRALRLTARVALVRAGILLPLYGLRSADASMRYCQNRATSSCRHRGRDETSCRYGRVADIASITGPGTSSAVLRQAQSEKSGFGLAIHGNPI